MDFAVSGQGGLVFAGVGKPLEVVRVSYNRGNYHCQWVLTLTGGVVSVLNSNS